MKILITGHNGLIGDALYTELSKAHEVWGVEKGEDLYGSPDVIIHCGANTFVRDCIKNPNLGFENVQRTYEVYEYARKKKADVVFFSSGRLNHESYNPYTVSKRFGEDLAKAYEVYGVRTLVIRPETVWGWSRNNERVINKWLLKAPEPVEVYGSPSKELSPIHINDFVPLFLSLFYHKKNWNTKAFTISGAPMRVDEILKIIGAEGIYKDPEPTQPQTCEIPDLMSDNFKQRVNENRR